MTQQLWNYFTLHSSHLNRVFKLLCIALLPHESWLPLNKSCSNSRSNSRIYLLTVRIVEVRLRKLPVVTCYSLVFSCSLSWWFIHAVSEKWNNHMHALSTLMHCKNILVTLALGEYISCSLDARNVANLKEDPILPRNKHLNELRILQRAFIRW